MRQYLFLTALIFGIGIASPSDARTVSYPDAWTTMISNNGDMNSVHIHYTPTINYSIAENINQLQINVYDLQGRLVEKLYEGIENAGYHEIKWNASALSSGIYFVKIQAFGIEENGLYSKTQKITLVK